MKLQAHGIETDLPPGWEGRISLRRPPVTADRPAARAAERPMGRAVTDSPVVHLANFPLPEQRGDFGSGAVDLMGSGHVLVVLFEYGPESVGQALFRRQGLPTQLRPGHVQPARRCSGRCPARPGARCSSPRPDGRSACTSCSVATARRPRLVPLANRTLSATRIAPRDDADRASTCRIASPSGRRRPRPSRSSDDGVHRDPSLDDPIAGRRFSQRVVRAGVVDPGAGHSRDAASSPRPRWSARRSPSARSTSSSSPARPTATSAAPAATAGRRSAARSTAAATRARRQLRRRLVEGRQRRLLLRRGPLHHRLQRQRARRRAPAAARAASCDDRRTCCNQFRYGQCHQEIACYGPVVCRVATCTPPWQYDPPAPRPAPPTTRTVNHGAPCSHRLRHRHRRRRRRHRSAGSTRRSAAPAGSSARSSRPEKAVQRPPGPVRRLPQRPHLLDVDHRRPRGPRCDPQRGSAGSADVHGVLGYPTADTNARRDQRSRYSNFERGRIYYWSRPAPSRSTGRSTSSTRR